ncbi:MAG: tryptophan--tRNA ligase [bacterium]|nr:tryptophan--tRNA ligase [bacterium]
MTTKKLTPKAEGAPKRKPVLVSGIQPTGKLHLGNYLGALKHFVELQNSGKYNCYFFIADLHSMTEAYNPDEKPSQILDLAADYLAAGIDSKQSILFVQSEVPAHAELAWILNTVTPIGELKRMTQFKEKGGTDGDATNAGLFDYPVLMAADILLYNAAVVPVGDDQDQHLELTRTLVRRFNKRYGDTFVEPQPLHTNVLRLMSLDDPRRKMSKSRSAGCLFLDDEPAVIRKKIMRAVTDSGNEVLAEVEGKPAMTNLLLIYSALSGIAVRDIEKKYAGKGYGEFKKGLAEVVVNSLTPFQAAKKKLKPAIVEKALDDGAKQARTVAIKKLREVYASVGLMR